MPIERFTGPLDEYVGEDTVTGTFRRKVERALFDEEGVSRIRVMEEQNRRMSIAMFNEEGKSRIAGLEGKMDKIMKYVDRGQYTWWLIVIIWTVFGSLVGWFLKPH